MNNQPQGGTSVHMLVTGTPPKRAINNSAGGARLVNNVAVVPTAHGFSSQVTQNLFFKFKLISVKAAGVKRAQGSSLE